MAVNPLGFVCPFDGGNPRIITGKAIEGILPGYHVAWSGAAACIGSDATSYTKDDIWVHVTASGDQQGGISLGSAASGGFVGVVTRGAVICTAGDTVTAGELVSSNGSHAVIDLPTGSVSMAIGRAITNAGSESYTLVHLGGLL